ncbi:MAG: hypothetical protein WBN81_11675 [Gammaproteobacteria bacterium]
MQALWLPLLMALVFSVSVSNSVCWAESQYQEIEPVSGYVPDSSEGDTLITASMPARNANNLLSADLNVAQMLSSGTGSDAYPSLILHGPPASNHSA